MIAQDMLHHKVLFFKIRRQCLDSMPGKAGLLNLVVTWYYLRTY